MILLGYCYAGYPLLLAFLAKIMRNPARVVNDHEPFVSVVLPAFNEEVVISRCLDSLLAQNYPKEKLEIVVGSDCSSDRTNDILRDYASRFPQVRALCFTDRRGKIPTLADATKQSNGEILVFVDADVTVSRDFVKSHARNYADPEVGAVSGELRIVSGDKFEVMGTEDAYWSIESKVRENEGLIHSTVGVYGGNYSIRRSLWKEAPSVVLTDDFWIALIVLESGKRIVTDRGALAIESYDRTVHDEYRRKTRNAASGISALVYLWHLMLPNNLWGFFTLIPHKLLRWGTPFLLMLIILAATVQMIRVEELWATSIVIGSLGFLVTAIIGWILERANVYVPVFRHAFWILSMNAAFVYGIAKYAFRWETRMWKTVRTA